MNYDSTSPFKQTVRRCLSALMLFAVSLPTANAEDRTGQLFVTEGLILPRRGGSTTYLSRLTSCTRSHFKPEIRNADPRAR